MANPLWFLFAAGVSAYGQIYAGQAAKASAKAQAEELRVQEQNQILNAIAEENEIVRATLESVAYQSYDLFNAMKNDGLKPNLVKVDGGMVKNNWFSQFLSDTINTKVIRPKVQETTALGAALMAGLKIGVYKYLSDFSKIWKIDKKFIPKLSKSYRTNLLKGWEQAIRKTLV